MDKMNRKNKNRKVWKIAAGMAAACVLTVGVTSVANPVLAKEIFSSVFGNLVENAQGEKYEKEDTEMYTKLGKNATSVQDEIGSVAGAGELCDDNGEQWRDRFCVGCVL